MIFFKIISVFVYNKPKNSFNGAFTV